ncbi:hypothetical protein BXZ70DRAFT_670628 [Cristinia sonorae]|uniref:F-box domain-containing protein n=1 Tax=Cristinia sonorae TaxID=1940300 RepID=A0A8K0UW04_9AGAR|nr:hypothetical protein BXZ70DRAFT_670628 [Cristinia sonorae]
MSSTSIATSPINRLPPETLIHIFGFIHKHALICDFFPEYINNFHREAKPGAWRTFYDWISLLHVCRYWRCAMSDTSLWSTIVVDGSVNPSKVLNFSIARAGTVPPRIHISLDTNQVRVTPLSIIPLDAIAGLQELRVQCYIQDFVDGGLDGSLGSLALRNVAAPALSL